VRRRVSILGSERAAAFADDFAAVNAQAVAFARSCGADDWARPVPGEDWSVGVVLHHIAEGHANGYRWLSAMSAGTAVTDSAEDIDRANAEHARRAESAGAADTVALLEENGDRLEDLLRSLSDEQLDRTAPFGPAGGAVFATADFAPVTARHAQEHLEHARRACDHPA
jgi:uncharacterized damage-inducible protein DinB